MGINFAHFNRRENRRSLAIRRSQGNHASWGRKNQAILRRSGENRFRNRRQSRDWTSTSAPLSWSPAFFTVTLWRVMPWERSNWTTCGRPHSFRAGHALHQYSPAPSKVPFSPLFWWGSPCKTSSWSSSLNFCQFCCAEPWNFWAEVFAEVFYCSECPSKTSPKTSAKTSPQTSPKTSAQTAALQSANFAQNFALQTLFANLLWAPPRPPETPRPRKTFRRANLEGKELGPKRCRPFYAIQSSELNFPIFLGKKARIQKKEGFIRTPPNRYGPSSSLSNKYRAFLCNEMGHCQSILDNIRHLWPAFTGKFRQVQPFFRQFQASLCGDPLETPRRTPPLIVTFPQGNRFWGGFQEGMGQWGAQKGGKGRAKSGQ